MLSLAPRKTNANVKYSEIPHFTQMINGRPEGIEGMAGSQ